MKIDSPKRSLAKTISWRVFSLFVTFSVTLLITRSTAFAFSVSILDNLIKMFSYYVHERCWTSTDWGRVNTDENSTQPKSFDENES